MLGTTTLVRRGRTSARWRVAVAFGLVAILVASHATVADATKPKTRRVSVATDGIQATSGSTASDISWSGRFIAFESFADDLIPSDTNGQRDVFVHDRKKRKTKRVSVRTGGVEAVGGHSSNPSISADGRFVAFDSGATNLVDGDTNKKRDVFVHDRKKRKTKRVSVRTGGGQADDDSQDAAISADGRFVAFWSRAENLVGNDSNLTIDIFVHDRRRKRTKRVSVSTGEVQADGSSTGPAISADGRFVAFHSNATNLVGNDTNDVIDVFVRDRRKGRTKRVSISSNEAQALAGSTGPAISADGRFVAFSSLASTLVGGDTNNHEDVFVRDRKRGRTKRVSLRSNEAQGDGRSEEPDISPDGRFVSFTARATNLVKNDTNDLDDIFVRDRRKGRTRRVSVGPGGAQGTEGDSGESAISRDGRFVSFWSDMTDLIANDTNDRTDVFRRGPLR